MTNLTDTRIFAVEARDEHRRLAARIHLVVDSADFEDSSGSWSYFHINKTGSVFYQNSCAKSTVDG